MPVFKVWSQDRMIRKCITTKTVNLDELKSTISDKFQKVVNIICLENDGTFIEDDESLDAFKGEVLMFLEKDSEWIHCQAHASSPTVSVNSSLSSINSSASTSAVSDFDSETFDYDLLLDDLPTNILQILKENKRLNFTEYSLFTQILVDAIRIYIGKYCGRKNLKRVSEYIVSKYPTTFMDVDDDNVKVGVGYTGLLRKLEDRNNYLNRNENLNANDLNKKFARKRHSKSLQVGCVQWQPGEMPEGESLDTLQEKKIKLMEYHDMGVSGNENVKKYMTETYSYQRLYLNSSTVPSIENIKTEWPYLLESQFIKEHFHTLTNCDIVSKLNMSKDKYRKVIKFLNNTEETNEDLNHILINFLKAVTRHFKDNMESIFMKIKDGTPRNDVGKEVEVLTPCILLLNDSLYYICVEKILINDGYDNFYDAFCDMFALYFILNMKYPTVASFTYEFVQRYILKLNQDEGTKSSKKSVMRTNTILNKVLSLINKLSTYKY